MTQHTSRKKGGIWFFVLPLVIVGALAISRNAAFTNKKFISNLSTKFTPEELASLVNDFDREKIAGKCSGKGFFEFVNETEDGYKTYNFYLPRYKNHKSDEYYKSDQDECEKDLDEQIRMHSKFDNVAYLIKDEKKYDALIAYIAGNTGNNSYIYERNSYYRDKKHYIFNDAIIIDCGYRFDEVEKIGKFCVRFYSSNSLKQTNKIAYEDSVKEFNDSVKLAAFKQRTIDSVQAIKNQEKKEFDNSPKVCVASTHIVNTIKEGWDRSYLIELFRGDRVKIIDSEGLWYRCTYISPDKKTTSGWISRKDVTR